jgi:hypothetical protein
MARTLTDGEREVLAELNADARDLAAEWLELHEGCDVEPCAECEAREALDADTYAALVEEARAEYEAQGRPEPPDGEYPF